MNNSSVHEKTGSLLNSLNFHYIQKMSKTTYYERNRDVILNRAKDYYKNNKELLRESKK